MVQLYQSSDPKLSQSHIIKLRHYISSQSLHVNIQKLYTKQETTHKQFHFPEHIQHKKYPRGLVNNINNNKNKDP